MCLRFLSIRRLRVKRVWVLDALHNRLLCLLQVISGCEWGNILVWGEKFIEIEVTRKFRKPCHSAPIIVFLYSEHEELLTSVSMDGTIKFWNYRTVESADPPENDRVLEMEPSYVISIQDSIGDSKIMGMSKIDGNPESYDYFIQVINDCIIYSRYYTS